MKQTELTVDETLRVITIRMLHTESGQWILTSSIRRKKNAASELVRIGRLYKRIVRYLHTEPEGHYGAFSQVKLESQGLTLAIATRTAITEHPQAPVPTRPKAVEPPPVSPVPAAVEPAISASKPKRGRSGTVTSIAQARTRKAQKP